VTAMPPDPGAVGLTVTAVICAYTERRWDDLLAAIDSIAAQDRPVAETVVCIDHNAELAGRVAVARPAVRVIENEERQGLSGGRNTAVRYATADVVAFLDDDAVAHHDWTLRLLDAFEDDDVVGVGGTGRPAWELGRPGWFPEEFDWVVGCTHRGTPTRRAAVRNVIGCNMAFRRNALLATGGFKYELGRVGTLPLGCEETELCIRLRREDPSRRVVFEPDCVVEHHVTPERHGFGYFRRRCFAEGASKSTVSSLVGSEQGMATERAYAARVLPAAVLAGLARGVRGDLDGIRRAGAIVVGLSWFAAGFVRAEIGRRTKETPS
jgi:GT2 family glycosyltransferase